MPASPLLQLHLLKLVPSRAQFQLSLTLSAWALLLLLLQRYLSTAAGGSRRCCLTTLLATLLLLKSLSNMLGVPLACAAVPLARCMTRGGLPSQRAAPLDPWRRSQRTAVGDTTSLMTTSLPASASGNWMSATRPMETWRAKGILASL